LLFRLKPKLCRDDIDIAQVEGPQRTRVCVAVMLREMHAHATLAPGQKYPGIGEATFSRTDVVNQPATWKAFVSIVMIGIISSNRGCRCNCNSKLERDLLTTAR
jgi:CO dehydrogenase nickel-insertion accessory protein CooC1